MRTGRAVQDLDERVNLALLACSSGCMASPVAGDSSIAAILKEQTRFVSRLRNSRGWRHTFVSVDYASQRVKMPREGVLFLVWIVWWFSAFCGAFAPLLFSQ